jgi:hypothetical protein
MFKLGTLLLGILSLVLQNPVQQTIVNSHPVGSGSNVSVDNHSYYQNSGLGGCDNTNTCVLTTGSNFTISTTGDGVLVLIWFCFDATCVGANTGTLALADGTNTYAQVSAASYLLAPGGTQGVVAFSACNATAGTYTLTLTTTDNVNGFHYVFAEAVALKNAHATGCVDTSVSNVSHALTGTAASVTSAGNVSASGSVAIAGTHCGGTTVSNTGTYTTLDSNSSDGSLVADFVNPTSGSTTTAAMTCGSSAVSVASLVAFQK